MTVTELKIKIYEALIDYSLKVLEKDAKKNENSTYGNSIVEVDKLIKVIRETLGEKD